MKGSLKLTSRQAEVLQVLVRFQDRFGFPPTCLELAGEMGFKSANAAAEHLKVLARKGAIAIKKEKARGIQITGHQTVVQQRDEALELLRHLLAGQARSAARAEALLKRYSNHQMAAMGTGVAQ